jgi:WD40-like Beta Propeller Repeat
MPRTHLFPAAALVLLWPLAAGAQVHIPPLVPPIFYSFSTPAASDYRPVVNATASAAIFERTPAKPASVTTLYIADLATLAAKPFVTTPGARADWCWRRSASGSLSVGPVAFSSSDGIYRVDADGSHLTLLENTAGMIYPSWYPDCLFLAVDVGGVQVTAAISATTGATLVPRLANPTVWAGFPSVDQADPLKIAFAGEFNALANYYDQDLNYAWVTDRSVSPPRVFPLDQRAPRGASFLQIYQARAGWWSPDGLWFAFESNRVCQQIDGTTYAIFIQDAAGTKPAMQVSDCKWNAEHPKWFPPGTTGDRTLLIAAVAPAAGGPFAIATFDVSGFVRQ